MSETTDNVNCMKPNISEYHFSCRHCRPILILNFDYIVSHYVQLNAEGHVSYYCNTTLRFAGIG